jgi:hypothetical protein
VPGLIALDDRSFNHDQAAFQLRGKHADASCDSCHRGKAEERRRYVGIETSGGCSCCHEDPHGRPDATCSFCHDRDGSWSAEGFDHASMARFSVDALHRKVACEGCHDPGLKLRFRFGPAADEAAAEAFSCSGCHRTIERAMEGEIAGREVVRSPHANQVSCTECHEPSSGSGPEACSRCHPADYDLLAVEWYGRLEIERLRLGAGSADRAPAARAVRELRAHNWEGAAQWLRGEAARPGSSRGSGAQPTKGGVVGVRYLRKLRGRGEAMMARSRHAFSPITSNPCGSPAGMRMLSPLPTGNDRSPMETRMDPSRTVMIYKQSCTCLSPWIPARWSSCHIARPRAPVRESITVLCRSPARGPSRTSVRGALS